MNADPKDMKVRDVAHPMLPALTVEDISRQRAVVTLHRILTPKVPTQTHRHFNQTGAVEFEPPHGRRPASLADIEQSLFNVPTYRL